MLTRKQLHNRKRNKARGKQRKALSAMGLCTHCGFDKPMGEALWELCTPCSVIEAAKRAVRGKRKHVIVGKDTLNIAAIRWAAGDKKAGDELVKGLYPYFYGLTNWYPKGVFGRDDAMQELAILALASAKVWRPDGGASFLTFVSKGHFQYQLERHSLETRYVARLQVHILIRLNRLLKVNHNDDVEIADDDLVNDARVIARQPIYLDSDDGNNLIDYSMADSAPSAEDMLIEQETLAPMRALMDGVQGLNPREAWIAEQRLFVDEPMTLDAIGKGLGITRERVRQIECSMLNKLKAKCGVTLPPAKVGADGLTAVQRHERSRTKREAEARKRERSKVFTKRLNTKTKQNKAVAKPVKPAKVKRPRVAVAA